MLALTKKTDYALIALTFLVHNKGQVATARAISERYRVPLALLMNILKVLAQKGMIRSMRGVKGGYLLEKPPESITLYDLILAIEGPVRFVRCASELPNNGHVACELLEVCPVSRPVKTVNDRLVGFLKEVTLADVAADMTTTTENETPVRLRYGVVEHQA